MHVKHIATAWLLLLGRAGAMPATVSVPALAPQPEVTVACSGSRSQADYYAGCTAGSADDVVIRAAIASLPNGGAVKLLEGTYHLNPVQGFLPPWAAVLVPSNVDLSGVGQGATTLVLDPNPNAATCTVATIAVQSANVVGFAAANNAFLHDMTIDGGLGSGTTPRQCPGVNDNAGNAVRLDTVTNSGVYNVEAKNAYTHGIFLNSVNGNSQHVALRNNATHGNGQIGVHVHADDAEAYSIKDFMIDGLYNYANSVLAAVPYGGGAPFVQTGGVFVSYTGDSYGVVTNVFSHDEPGPCITIFGSGPGNNVAGSAKDIVFSNITAHGCGTANILGQNAAVSIAGPLTTVLLDNLVVDGTPQDCIMVGPGFPPYAAGGIKITGGRLASCGRNGVFSVDNMLSNLEVSGVEIVNVGAYSIDLESVPGMSQAHVDLTNNTIRAAGTGCLKLNGGNNPFQFVRIAGNRIIGCTGVGMFLNNVSDFTIADNTVLDATLQGIYVQGASSHGNINSNTVGLQSTPNGNSLIQLTSSTSDINLNDTLCLNLNAVCIYSQGAAASIVGTHGVGGGVLLDSSSTANRTAFNRIAITNNGVGTGANANVVGAVSP